MKPELPLELHSVIHHEIRDAKGRVLATVSCGFDDTEERRTTIRQARAVAEILAKGAEETHG